MVAHVFNQEAKAGGYLSSRPARVTWSQKQNKTTNLPSLNIPKQMEMNTTKAQISAGELESAKPVKREIAIPIALRN